MGTYPEAQYVIDELSPMLEELLPVKPGSVEYATPGTYTFVVPKKVTKLTFYAKSATSGSGGGGAGGQAAGINFDEYGNGCMGGAGGGGAGGGGGSVQRIVQGTISVTPEQVITIKVGAGGNAGYGGTGGLGTTSSCSATQTGARGGNGGASGVTSIGSDLVFPSVAGGSGGYGGGPGHQFNGNGISAPSGSGGQAGTNASTQTYTTSTNTIVTSDKGNSVTNTNPTNGSSGYYDNTWYVRNYGGTGGYVLCTDDSSLSGVQGGSGGTGANGGKGTAATSGTSGRNGKNGYVKLSWG